MSDLLPDLPANLDRRTSGVSVFEPEATKKRDAKADAVIDYAKRVRDWPTLEGAIDKKLEDQAEFVRWWDQKVQPRGRVVKVSDQKLLSVEEVERLTSITNLQKHKWARRLKDPEKYRGMSYDARRSCR
jgi:hypothetical protein